MAWIDHGKISAHGFHQLWLWPHLTFCCFDPRSRHARVDILSTFKVISLGLGLAQEETADEDQ